VVGQSFVGRALAAFSPQDRKALGVALAAALLLHAAVMNALSRRPAPRAVDASAMATRLIDASPPPESLAAPIASSIAPPVASPVTPPVEPLVAPPVTTPELAPGAVSTAIATTAPPLADARPVPALLALPLRGEGSLAYAFVIDGQPGEASLNFRIEDGRYDMTLERRAGDRELPLWRSEGRVGPQGLQPERHRVRRQGRERELLVFDQDAVPPRLLVGARAYMLSAGTQDRLSWWLQLAALMAAEPAPHVGLRLRMPVAGATGVHDWDFEVVARDGDRWLLQRELRRGPGRPALQWSAWLDGQRGFLPVDLRFSLDDDEQWALRLLD
jgi:hypothetical protein